MQEKEMELIKRFKQLDTTCISDAMDKLGIPGGLLGIKSVHPGKRICGTAYTVHYVPCGQIKGTVGDFLDDVEPGQVVVIDNGGREYCTVWGDIMSIVAKKKGVEGTLIDGVCRDLPVLLESGYAVFSKGHYMVTGKDRVEVDHVQVPVAVSGIQIRPGDIIVGDDTGAVAVPLDRAEEVASVAENIDAAEKRIIELVLKGMPLKEARRQIGYHKLQTKG